MRALDTPIRRLPSLLICSSFNTRACALMLLGQRDDQAQSVFLQHRGGSIAGRSWDEAVREKFEDLRSFGCIRPLMEEIEHAFATSPALPTSGSGEGQNERPRRVPKRSRRTFRTSIWRRSVRRWTPRRRIDRIRSAAPILSISHRRGRIINQVIEDRNALERKISDVAMAFLLEGEFRKALAATEAYSLPGSQNPFLPARHSARSRPVAARPARRGHIHLPHTSGRTLIAQTSRCCTTGY